ncbi:hypothetical protein mRhiFer1_009719 [Rhinolophus ferrumequinum]|uniref:Uncharacterized protein n=1 Tax=Rhinolophus ferrumequinum TaxID=59479 RepID=A0A7J7ZD25_RHIFE|nr:hypothetical protein mRhiFer1_009719 [Rhinolophus ferrumequinum]
MPTMFATGGTVQVQSPEPAIRWEKQWQQSELLHNQHPGACRSPWKPREGRAPRDRQPAPCLLADPHPRLLHGPHFSPAFLWTLSRSNVSTCSSLSLVPSPPAATMMSPERHISHTGLHLHPFRHRILPNRHGHAHLFPNRKKAAMTLMNSRVD